MGQKVGLGQLSKQWAGLGVIFKAWSDLYFLIINEGLTL